MIIGFLGMIAKLSDICFSCLAKFSSSFSHSPLKIILKQLFPSSSVNIAEYLSEFVSVNIREYLLRLRRILVKYHPSAFNFDKRPLRRLARLETILFPENHCQSG